jgi:hypothetical protein
MNELESIYGVHHEKRRKESGSVEVHTKKAKEIVKVVLEKLDTNGDGFLTMREFVAGGVGGLPNFKGVEHLGHHYGEPVSSNEVRERADELRLRLCARRCRGGILPSVRGSDGFLVQLLY